MLPAFVPYAQNIAHAQGLFSDDVPGLTLTVFITGSNLFPDASVWVTAYKALSAMYFQVCSNSAYPQHSGERYRSGSVLLEGKPRCDAYYLYCKKRHGESIKMSELKQYDCWYAR